MLHAAGGSEAASVLRQIADLDRGVAAAQRDYRLIHHDTIEDDLYRRFDAQWLRYRNLAARDRAIMSGADGAVRRPQEQTSLAAYDAASRTLGLLTDRNVASAREVWLLTVPTEQFSASAVSASDMSIQ